MALISTCVRISIMTWGCLLELIINMHRIHMSLKAGKVCIALLYLTTIGKETITHVLSVLSPEEMQVTYRFCLSCDGVCFMRIQHNSGWHFFVFAVWCLLYGVRSQCSHPSDFPWHITKATYPSSTLQAKTLFSEQKNANQQECGLDSCRYIYQNWVKERLRRGLIWGIRTGGKRACVTCV